MKLVEYLGKELLADCGIAVPKGSVSDYSQFTGKVVVKAQVIGGGRKKAGLVTITENAQEAVDELLKKKYNGAPVDTVLVEEFVEHTDEYFLAITYDTETRGPVVLFSKSGGIDVEDAKDVQKIPISANGLQKEDAFAIDEKLAPVLMKLAECFFKYDCLNVEINPLFVTKNGFVAGDAKVTIDDCALPRQERFKDFSEDNFLTEREIAAREIDKGNYPGADDKNYRGVAGKTFVDLDGDIAVLASGGGASLTVMDTIIQAGGRPANYTEYSGNPPREKVKALTKVTLDRPGLKGCLVVGGKANFTDIFETLSGVMEALEELKPSYPILIRRAGPRDKEAFDMIRKKAKELNLDITLYGEEIPMSKAAHLLVEKVYK